MKQGTNGIPEKDDILEIDLSVLFKAVLSRLPLCAGLCGTVIALTLAYCFLSTPMFVAKCRMLVEPGNLNISQFQDVYKSEFGSDTRSRDAFIATQIELITSDHILARVFEHFNFAEKKAFENVKEPLNALANLIEIERIPNTNLLDIGFKDPDPVFSAEVSNFLARAYMDDSNQRASGFSQRGLEKLQDELLNMEASRLKAIDDLNAYKAKHNILSVEAAQKLGIARLTELDKAGVSAQEALATAQATVNAIDRWREQGLRLDSIPDAIQNPTLTQFKTARLQAQASLLKALQDFGSNHKSVEIQRLVIRDMDKAIAEETENSLISARARLEQAKVRVAIIEAERNTATEELKSLDRIADTYKLLADNLTAAENMYKQVLQRVNELKIARSADSGSGGTFQIIVPAAPPVKAAYPEKAKIMIIAVLASGMFAVMLCIVLELADTTLKRREDVEAVSGLPVFGFIPLADGHKDNPDFTAYAKPQSALAEAFRALRTSLSLSASGRSARIIAVTSAVSGDGKTFTALNLAVTYARAGKRVLLVDTDLRRRRLTSLLGTQPSTGEASASQTPATPTPVTEAAQQKGLSNLLAQDADQSALPSLIQTPLADVPLAFLSSGPQPPNPSELLSGEVLRPLTDTLLQHFDIIIADAPPVLAVSDTRTLAALPELRFLIVVRMLTTEKKQLAMMTDALNTVGANIIGTVMNNADIPTDKGGYGYYKYSYDYGYGYGYGDNTARTKPWWKKLARRA